MTELSKGKSFVTVVGRVKIGDRTFSGRQISEKSGYEYARVNLGIETEEGNIVYGEMMGGYFPNRLDNKIYAVSKEDNSRMEINWNDRFNENIIESVADYRVYNIGIKRDDNGKLIVKKFLSAYDVHDYLQENLEDGMLIVAKGSFAFSEYKGETQRRFMIKDILLPYQKEGKEIKMRANFVQTILLDENSYKKISKEDMEEGEVVISAHVVDYVGKKDGKEIKKNIAFPIPITVKINLEKPELTKKILDTLFKVKKNKVRELTIEGDIIEGYEQQQIDEKDIELSKDIQELIDLGLYSKEEAIKKLMVRGNRVSKLVFTRPYLIKDKDDDNKLLLDKDDDKYKPEDLIVEIEDEEEVIVDDENPLDSEAEESDEDWLKALGIQ